MKILIAPDKFKGSLTAEEVCEAIARGLKTVDPSMETIFHPLADGGDGSIEVLSRHLKLQKHEVNTSDPLGRPMTTHYYTDEKTAFIELASASGLVRLTEKEKNPMLTSTHGTGKIVENAMIKGFTNIFLFLGGSATNDAGMGIANALGFQFLDDENQWLEPIGKNLCNVRSIRNTSSFDFDQIEITLLCDVSNPLFGPEGASQVYAAQKGANEEQVEYLDKGLRAFNNVLKGHTGKDVSQISGMGAAGGIGASLVALCGAKLAMGFEIISKLTGLENKIQSADHIISGEGKLDAQSFQGKVVGGVAALCEKHQKPLTLFVGKNELTEIELEALRVKQVFSIFDEAENKEDAMSKAAFYLEVLAHQFYKDLIQDTE